jgi:hypothetical protein
MPPSERLSKRRDWQLSCAKPVARLNGARSLTIEEIRTILEGRSVPFLQKKWIGFLGMMRNEDLAHEQVQAPIHDDCVVDRVPDFSAMLSAAKSGRGPLERPLRIRPGRSPDYFVNKVTGSDNSLPVARTARPYSLASEGERYGLVLLTQ